MKAMLALMWLAMHYHRKTQVILVFVQFKA